MSNHKRCTNCKAKLAGGYFCETHGCYLRGTDVRQPTAVCAATLTHMGLDPKVYMVNPPASNASETVDSSPATSAALDTTGLGAAFDAHAAESERQQKVGLLHGVTATVGTCWTHSEMRLTFNRMISPEERALLGRLVNYAIIAYNTRVPDGVEDLRPEGLKKTETFNSAWGIVLNYALKGDSFENFKQRFCNHMRFMVTSMKGLTNERINEIVQERTGNDLQAHYDNEHNLR